MTIFEALAISQTCLIVTVAVYLLARWIERRKTPQTKRSL